VIESIESRKKERKKERSGIMNGDKRTRMMVIDLMMVKKRRENSQLQRGELEKKAIAKKRENQKTGGRVATCVQSQISPFEKGCYHLLVNGAACEVVINQATLRSTSMAIMSVDGRTLGWALSRSEQSVRFSGMILIRRRR
jgi:hypothetical protein